MKVYQTWKNYKLPDDFQAFHNSWLITFDTILYNDTDVLSAIYLYCNLEDPLLCKNLDKYSNIQKIDIWRYIVIYINGGIYSDIDVGIKNPYMFYLQTKQNCNLILFKESPSFYYEPFKYIRHLLFYYCGLNSYARLNQLRQSIFYATPKHPLLQTILYTISHSNIEDYSYKFVEPYLTFELTGPGIFTDIAQLFLKNEDCCIVQYNNGLEILDYHHYGTWKKHNTHTFFRHNIVFINVCLLIIIFLRIFNKYRFILF